MNAQNETMNSVDRELVQRNKLLLFSFLFFLLTLITCKTWHYSVPPMPRAFCCAIPQPRDVGDIAG